jgi:hypothetical protein
MRDIVEHGVVGQQAGDLEGARQAASTRCLAVGSVVIGTPSSSIVPSSG